MPVLSPSLCTSRPSGKTYGELPSHVLFSESALVRWRALSRNDGATRFAEVAGGLNEMTIARFEQTELATAAAPLNWPRRHLGKLSLLLIAVLWLVFGAPNSPVFKALVEWYVRLLADDGLFARQAAMAPPRAFPAKLFGLDVLLDADGHPWLIEMQRTPAARGQPLVEKINLEMYTTMFRMGHAPLIDDATPPAEIERLRVSDEARRAKEAAIEQANRGKFVPLDL